MKKVFTIIIMCLLSQISFAHNARNSQFIAKEWNIAKQNKTIVGSFFMYKNGNVFIEDVNGNISNFPLTLLSLDDQNYVVNKYQSIEKINYKKVNSIAPSTIKTFDYKYLFVLFIIAIISIGFYQFASKKQLQLVIPLIIISASVTLFGFTTGLMKTTTDPLFVNSAFAPFKPEVNTRYDANYFYVESLGLPTHLMMATITGWQQQYPIPQCYVGTNAWSIPLNPVKATTPVPVNQQHFLRGAVAVAANGIAIFNPYTNTGVDAFLDGQLDNFGGHCGRADDYHYHTAPLFLDSKTTDIIPIAFALDGYAVYGSLEPDGTAMKTLDANHGHDGSNGVYHYHGTTTAPYMIGNMVGKVTEDSTLQIIPQASAKGVRPAGTPLKGAVITSCIPNGNGNGYKLTYTLAGVTDSVVYSWTPAGAYTFNYYVSGVLTTTNYKGAAICTVPNNNTNTEEISLNKNDFSVYPNPSKELLYLQLENNTPANLVKDIAIYSLNGTKVYATNQFEKTIDLKNFTTGIYFIKIQFSGNLITKKIIVQ
jgi:multisubunit Na+/H+ antiporter MnhC subunit